VRLEGWRRRCLLSVEEEEGFSRAWTGGVAGKEGMLTEEGLEELQREQ
jgi:hypothetical protein